MVSVSVVIPVYNVEKYLSECLDSVINQSLKDIEIICVNDGSTDNSLFILEEYSKKDERIKIISHENRGTGFTRKVGLDNSNGDYVFFLDSDDFLELDALELLLDNALSNDSDLVLFKIIRYNHLKNSKNYSLPVFDLDYLSNDFNNFTFDYKSIKEYVLNYSFAPYLKLYKKEFMDSYDDFFFEGGIRYEDVPLHVQVLLRAKMSFCPKFLLNYRISNETSVMNTSYDDSVFDIFKVIDIVEDFLLNNGFYDEFRFEFNKFKATQIMQYILPSASDDFLLKAKEELKKIDPAFIPMSFGVEGSNIIFSDLLNVNSCEELRLLMDKRNLLKQNELLNNKNKSLSSQCNLLENEVSTFKDYKSKYDALKEDMVHLEEFYENSKEDIINLSNRNKELSYENETLSNNLNNLNNQLSSVEYIKNDLFKYKQKNESLSNKISNLEKYISDLKVFNQDLSLEKQKLLDNNDLLINKQNSMYSDLDDLKSEIKDLNIQNKEFAFEREQLEKDFNILKSDYKNLLDNNSSLKSDYDELLNYKNNLSLENSNLVNEIKSLKDSEVLIVDNYKKELNSMSNEINSLSNKVKRLSRANRKLNKRIKGLNKFKKDVLNSKSWKLTKPLRYLMKLFK